mmetsp:Transcript_47493/g.117590  ORF Transcript_47493/g.117590 Transcript_47493/m.117590 type:complete len:672 (-) Transcript_47493:56-2071(-)
MSDDPGTSSLPPGAELSVSEASALPPLPSEDRDSSISRPSFRPLRCRRVLPESSFRSSLSSTSTLGPLADSPFTNAGRFLARKTRSGRLSQVHPGAKIRAAAMAMSFPNPAKKHEAIKTAAANISRWYDRTVAKATSPGGMSDAGSDISSSSAVLRHRKRLRLLRRAAINTVFICLFVGCGVLFYSFFETKKCSLPVASSCTCVSSNATGTLVTKCTEPWTAIDAMYFSVVTMSTVGYGDLTPSTNASRGFTCFYILVAIGMVFTKVAALISRITTPLFDKCRQLLAKFIPAMRQVVLDGLSPFEEPAGPVSYYTQNLLAPLILTALLQIGFALVFTSLEGWTVWFALYHCFVTITTVGYGDTIIRTDAGKLCAIAHILLSICIITAVITDADHLRDERHRLLHRARLLRRKLDRNLITSLDRDGNGLDKLEFVIGMLTKLELVTWDTVDPFLQQFDMLDSNKSGHLTHGDLEKLADIMEEQEEERAQAFRNVGLSRNSSVRSAFMGRPSDVNRNIVRGKSSRSAWDLSSSGSDDSYRNYGLPRYSSNKSDATPGHFLSSNKSDASHRSLAFQAAWNSSQEAESSRSSPNWQLGKAPTHGSSVKSSIKSSVKSENSMKVRRKGSWKSCASPTPRSPSSEEYGLSAGASTACSETPTPQVARTTLEVTECEP